jgi:hypothetical protein
MWMLAGYEEGRRLRSSLPDDVVRAGELKSERSGIIELEHSERKKGN